MLIVDHRKKRELQETRFCARHRELKAEIKYLKKKLAEANQQWIAALDARDVAEADMASLDE